jgi:hypothetical protein
MLRLDMLVAKNQDLLLYEDIDNFIKRLWSMSFDISTFVIATPNLSDKACISSGIDLASSDFLYGKSDSFQVVNPLACSRTYDSRYAIAEYQAVEVFNIYSLMQA